MRKTYQDIINEKYCDPTKRMDFILFFEVAQGNPNGDPDAGNLPRIDPTDNHGIVTDVATKRKIRDYFTSTLDRKNHIFIQNKTALNSLYFDTARESGKTNSSLSADDKEAIRSLATFLTPSENGDGPYDKLLAEVVKIGETEITGSEWLVEFASELNNVDFDPEFKVLGYLGENKEAKKIADEIIGEGELPDEIKAAIGKAKTGLAALIALGKKQSGKLGREGLEAMKRAMCQRFDDIRLFGAVLTAGTNAGQIRGPMQMTFARSLEPIIPLEASITRVAITKASDFLKKQTEMGRKPWLSWAAYEQHGFYNAPLGAAPSDGGTGVTRDDLARFWEALAYMFPVVKSASNGYMETVELIVFVHDDEKGRSCAPFYKLRDKVVPKEGLKKQENVTELTKGFSNVYEPITVADEENLNANGITVHRPLSHLRPDF